jgi:hypothetical protein
MMGGIGGDGKLVIRALRGGTTGELVAFLNDMQSAYGALYSFFWTEFAFVERSIFLERFGRGPQYRNVIISGGYFDLLLDKVGKSSEIKAEQIAPEYLLEVSRISIRSLGFWEFLGGLNPLQHIRGYLEERHNRRKDREYREQSEKERLRLENELLEATIKQNHLAYLRDQVELMREIKIDEEAIRQLFWQRLGPPLAALGRHQDTKLIGGPAPEDKTP